MWLTVSQKSVQKNPPRNGNDASSFGFRFGFCFRCLLAFCRSSFLVLLHFMVVAVTPRGLLYRGSWPIVAKNVAPQQSIQSGSLSLSNFPNCFATLKIFFCEIVVKTWWHFMLPNPVGHASNTELQSFSTALNQREHQKQAKPAKAKLTFSGVFTGAHLPNSRQTLYDDTFGGICPYDDCNLWQKAVMHTNTHTHELPQPHT